MYDETQAKPFSEASTGNHTKFHFSEAIAEQREHYLGDHPWEIRNQWRRFHGYNTGLWNGNWSNKAELYQQDNDRIFGAIAGQAELTPYQKEIGLNAFQRIHYSTHGSYYTVVDIAFYICVLIANEDYRGSGWVYYPTKTRYDQLRGDDHIRDGYEAFSELAESLDLDNPKGKIQKGLHKFKSEIEDVL